MTLTTPLTTAEDLLHMPDDGWRYELVRGELRKMAPASGEHGVIAGRITGPLIQYVGAHNLGVVLVAETGFLIARNPDTVRAPDLAFVRRDRIPERHAWKGYWPLAPDLVAEVISPNDLYTDVEEKALDWLDAGTQVVIVIDPRKSTVTVYRSRTDIRILTAADTLDAEPVLPGWSIPMQTLFA